MAGAQDVQDTFVADTTAAVTDTAHVVETRIYVQDTVIAYTPRAFSPNFKEKYRGDEFVYEVKPIDQTWWTRFVEWLNNLWESIFGPGDESGSSGKWTNRLIVTIACLVLLGVVYMIARAILNKEGMWIFGRSRKNIAVQDGAVEDITQMDFGKLIGETKATADYRQAVRYYYLWVLKKLSAREIIDWHWDKTNTDYLYEIKDDALRGDFEYLSYLYDHSWYGEFPLDETSFGKAEKAFLKTLNRL